MFIFFTFSEIVVKFFTFLRASFLNDFDVELILRVLAAPVLFKDSIGKLLNANNFIISFFIIEILPSPNKGFVVVKFMPWDVVLGTDAENQQSVFL